MAARRRCAACGRTFKVLPQVPDQTYCAEPACQRERRKLWQRDRRREDPDYRENQAQAQQAWLGRNPDYWRDYRERNPSYTEANRSKARDRSRERRDSGFAKMDETTPLASEASLAPGLYQLRVIQASQFAKMDECILVELRRVEPIK